MLNPQTRFVLTTFIKCYFLEHFVGGRFTKNETQNMIAKGVLEPKQVKSLITKRPTKIAITSRLLHMPIELCTFKLFD